MRSLTTEATPSRPHHLLLALAGALLVSLALLFAQALPASAHSRVVATSPDEGSSAAQPVTAVSVTMNENIGKVGYELHLTDSLGNEIALGQATVDGPTLAAPVTGPMAAGTFTVAYRVVSADGHPVDGAFAFTATVPNEAAMKNATPHAPQDDGLMTTYETPGATTTVPGATATAAPTSAAAEPAPQSSAPAEDANGVQPVPMIIGIGVGALALAAIVALLARRRRMAELTAPTALAASRSADGVAAAPAANPAETRAEVRADADAAREAREADVADAEDETIDIDPSAPRDLGPDEPRA